MIPKINFPTQYIIPNATTPTAPSVGNQAWGAWTQVIAATTFEYILCGVYHGIAFSMSASGNKLLRAVGEIGIGKSTAEVTIASWADMFWINKSAAVEAALLGKNTTYFFTPTLIPAGNRIAVRMWGTEASGSAIQTRIYLFGYKSSDWAKVQPYILENYLKGLVGKTTAIYPAPTGAEGGVSVPGTASAGYVYGAWTEVIPINTISTAFLITAIIAGIDTTPTTANTTAHMAVGIGPSGGEIIVDYISLCQGINGGQAAGGTFMLRRPVWCPPNTRVSLMVAPSSANEAYNAFVQVEVLK